MCPTKIIELNCKGIILCISVKQGYFSVEMNYVRQSQIQIKLEILGPAGHLAESLTALESSRDVNASPATKVANFFNGGEARKNSSQLLELWNLIILEMRFHKYVKAATFKQN